MSDPKPQKRPNIILIVPDQQRADTFGFTGNDHMITPNFDKLGREGVWIENCFTQGGCCMPARAAMFCGKYAHQLDILTNVSHWDGEGNWVECLRQAGYQTASFGGMHLKPWLSPCGFESRVVCENKNEPYPPDQIHVDAWIKYLADHGLERPLDYPTSMPDFYDRLGDVDFPLEEKFHEDVFLGQTVVDWLDERDDDRPLFLHVGWAGPHDPYDPPQRYKDMYAGRDIPQPNAVAGELQTKPPEQQKFMEAFETQESESTIRMSHATPERIAGMRTAYYAGVTLIDEWVGKILDRLDAKGLLEDAIVIVLSDHGDALGDNEMIYKWFMYDSITRVPMLVWGPKYFEKARPTQMVELFDIGPTILDMAGLEAPADYQCESFLGMLKGDASFTGKEYSFCEEKHIVMVRGHDWKLVYYNGCDHGELYDLVNDPGEHANLWDDPGCQDRKAKMIQAMEDWYARTGGRSASLQRMIDKFAVRT